MANVKYYVTSNGGTYIHWSQSLSGFGIIGKEMSFNGGGGNDSVYVQAGTSLDYTSIMDSGNDTIYLTGNLADYSQFIDQSTGLYILTRTNGLSVGQTEVIKFTVNDQNDVIYFANGHIVINGSADTRIYSATGTFNQLQTGWLTAGGTPAAGMVTITPTTATAPTKAYITDTTGVDIPLLPQPGQAIILKGSTGNDTVYVNAGTSVNFVDTVGLGNDRIYLTGALGDYVQSIDQGTGVYTFTRKAATLPAGQTEVVLFTVSQRL